MEYTVERAQPFLGKRVIVSLRHLHADGTESFSGLWGVIHSAHEGGLLVKVEGGIADKFWMLPPDLDALKPAAHAFYQMEGSEQVIEKVNFEAHFRTADSVEGLE